MFIKNNIQNIKPRLKISGSYKKICTVWLTDKLILKKWLIIIQKIHKPVFAIDVSFNAWFFRFRSNHFLFFWLPCLTLLSSFWKNIEFQNRFQYLYLRCQRRDGANDFRFGMTNLLCGRRQSIELEGSGSLSAVACIADAVLASSGVGDKICTSSFDSVLLCSGRSLCGWASCNVRRDFDPAKNEAILLLALFFLFLFSSIPHISLLSLPLNPDPFLLCHNIISPFSLNWLT